MKAAVDPVRVSGALYNLLGFRQQYGRVTWVASHFGISRPSLYRMEQRFLAMVREGPGRPRMSQEHNQIRIIEKRLEGLEKENADLRARLEEERREKQRCVARVRFFLISFGIPARPIARLIRECFRMRANRTDVLREARRHARRATQIMREYFWAAADDADIDEIFIEDLPLYIAAEPISMAVLKTSKEDRRTEERWTVFLKEMPNLRRTTGDRGTSLLAAVSKRKDLTHQSDVFHPKRLLGTELGKVEKRCYKLIGEEYKAEKTLADSKAKGKDSRAPSLRYRQAYRKAQEALELFDQLEEAVKVAFDALRFTTEDGKFNTAPRARELLDLAGAWIHEHLPDGWSKPKRALEDEYLLTFLEELEVALKAISVECSTPQDREYVLVGLTKLWENQARRRQRGRPVLIPPAVEQELRARCSNLPDVQEQLFCVLDRIHRASSAVECINSRVGFYRYSKRRFSGDFANLIAVRHNLSPFEEGKRAKSCPAKILGVNLPTYDIYELFRVN